MAASACSAPSLSGRSSGQLTLIFNQLLSQPVVFASAFAASPHKKRFILKDVENVGASAGDVYLLLSRPTL